MGLINRENVHITSMFANHFAEDFRTLRITVEMVVVTLRRREQELKAVTGLKVTELRDKLRIKGVPLKSRKQEMIDFYVYFVCSHLRQGQVGCRNGVSLYHNTVYSTVINYSIYTYTEYTMMNCKCFSVKKISSRKNCKAREPWRKTTLPTHHCERASLHRQTPVRHPALQLPC